MVAGWHNKLGTIRWLTRNRLSKTAFFAPRSGRSEAQSLDWPPAPSTLDSGKMGDPGKSFRSLTSLIRFAASQFPALAASPASRARAQRRASWSSSRSRATRAFCFLTSSVGEPEQATAFPSIRGEPLTRFAIHLLLRKAVDRASARCATLKKKRVSPHIVRHSTAMALLQSGVDIAVIALWLGHESIETTNVYLHANLAMKERALAKVLPVGTPFHRLQANDKLLTFLESL